MHSRKRTIIPFIAAGIMVFSGISAGISYAYLSASTETLQNVITAGTVQIELTEDKWLPDAHRAVVPGAVLAKNPAVINTGKNAAHIFLEIKIPMRTLSVVSSDHRKTKRESVELFSFIPDTENWDLIEQYQENDQMIYVYGYNRILYPGEKTSDLFDSVKMVNYLEGELETSESLLIDVQAKAIQTGVDTVGGSPKEIYNILLAQIFAETASACREQEEVCV